MESYKIKIFVIVVALVFLSCSAYAKPPYTLPHAPTDKLLSIYVDSNNRIYWNMGNPYVNIPNLLPPKSALPDSFGYKIDLTGFLSVMLEKKRLINSLQIAINVHMYSHYSCMDSILKVMKHAASVWNRKKAVDLGIEIKDLNLLQKFPEDFIVYFKKDKLEDVLEYVWFKTNILPAIQIKIPHKLTSIYHLRNGYWKDRILENQISLSGYIYWPKDKLNKLDKRAAKNNLSESDILSIPLEQYPEQIYYHEPEYPRLGLASGMESVVWVKALIDKEGKAKVATIIKSSDSKVAFDDAALKAAYKCRYKPAIQNGKPVESWVSYKVEFKSRSPSEKYRWLRPSNKVDTTRRPTN